MQPQVQNKLQNNSLNCTSYILRIHITQSDVPLQIYTQYPRPDLTGAARQLTGLPTYWGAKTSLEYRVLVNSRFHTPKNFRKLSEIWVRALTQARQPCPKQKEFKECWFAWAPNCLLARGAHKFRAGPGSYRVLWCALTTSWLQQDDELGFVIIILTEKWKQRNSNTLWYHVTIKFTVSKVTPTFPLYSLCELRTEGRRTARRTRYSHPIRRYPNSLLKKQIIYFQKWDNGSKSVQARVRPLCVCVCARVSVCVCVCTNTI